MSNLGGCISGCEAVTAADVDGDGIKEAVFADRDGQVTACRKALPGQSPVQIVWQKMIGDDAITKVVAWDIDGDAREEILLASKSGFIAALAGDGAVKWLRYAQNQVTDVEVAGVPGHSFILRSSTDGSIAAYDAKGEEMGRWTVGTPVSGLEIATAAGMPVIGAASGSTLVAIALGHPNQ